jgi:type II secretory pathway component PulC
MRYGQHSRIVKRPYDRLLKIFSIIAITMMTLKDIGQFLTERMRLQIAYLISTVMAFLLIWQIVELANVFHIDGKQVLGNSMSIEAIQKLPVIASWHLFGFYEASSLPNNLSETTLPLTLVGTFVATSAHNNQAVIAESGTEKIYTEGEDINVGAKIYKILPAYVILRHDGHLELLSMPRKNLVFDKSPEGLNFS